MKITLEGRDHPVYNYLTILTGFLLFWEEEYRDNSAGFFTTFMQGMVTALVLVIALRNVTAVEWQSLPT